MSAVVAAGLMALVLVVGATAGAQAQGSAQEEGTVNVEAGHPLGSSIHYVVEVTGADGTPADDATVTATAIDTEGNELEPATLTPFGATAADGVEVDDAGAQQGRYEGIVEFPAAGRWTVRFDASQPAGSAETTVEVLEAGASDLDAPDDGTGGFAPADDAGEMPSDGSGMSVLVIAIAALVALGGLAAAIRIVRRYGPRASSLGRDPDAPPDPGDQAPASDEANVGGRGDDKV